MIEAVLTALRDPTTRMIYLAFCVGVLVLPMIGLALWYHVRIGRTEGGKKLMERQGPYPRRGSGADMARAIERGAYGSDARRMQRRVYWFSGLWFLLFILFTGVLIWADHVNKGLR